MHFKLLFKILARAFDFLIGLVFVLWSLPLLMHPSLHMDESYYLGAARTVLSGDFLLTTFAFDKLFLPPFLLAPGILLVGENIIGFRIMGLLFSLASLFVFRRLLLALLEKSGHASRTELGRIGSNIVFGLLSVALFFHPLAHAHLISAMTEPFLVFFLLCAALKITRTTNWARTWTLASFVKLSSIMWAPFFLGVELWIYRRRPKELAREFIVSTKWLWVVAFVFMLFNRKKFAALSWFSQLGQSKSDSLNFFGRVGFWFSALFRESFSLGAGVLLITLGSLAVSIWLLKKRRSGAELHTRSQLATNAAGKSDAVNAMQLRWVIVLQASILLHFIGLPLSGAPAFERYLVIFLLHAVLGVVVGLYQLAAFFPAVPTLARALPVIMLSVTLLLGDFLRGHQPIEPGTQLGTSLETLRDFVPAKAILNSRHLWETYPYENKTWTRHYCAELECLWRTRSAPIFSQQYVFEKRDSNFHLERAPLLIDRKERKKCYQIQRQMIKVPLKDDLLTAFRERVRIKDGGAKVELVQGSPQVSSLAPLLAPAPAPSPELIQESGNLISSGSKSPFAAPLVTMQIAIKNIEFDVQGRLLLLDRFDPNSESQDLGVGFLLERALVSKPFALDALDVSSLLPIIWKGRVIRITRLDYPLALENDSRELIHYDRASNSVELYSDRVVADTRCLVSSVK